MCSARRDCRGGLAIQAAPWDSGERRASPSPTTPGSPQIGTSVPEDDAGGRGGEGAGGGLTKEKHDRLRGAVVETILARAAKAPPTRTHPTALRGEGDTSAGASSCVARPGDEERAPPPLPASATEALLAL